MPLLDETVRQQLHDWFVSQGQGTVGILGGAGLGAVGRQVEAGRRYRRRTSGELVVADGDLDAEAKAVILISTAWDVRRTAV